MVTGALVVAVAASVLTPGVPLTHTQATGVSPTFTIAVSSGDCIDGTIDQGETDLTIELLGPDEATGMRFDARERSVDLFTRRADADGVYSIRVARADGRSLSSPFTIGVASLTPSARCNTLPALEQRHAQAKQLFARGTGDALGEARAAFQDVAPRWSAEGERALELAARSGAGDSSYMLSDYGAAMVTYSDALGLSRALGDRRAEAEIVNNLAMAAWPLGRIPEALGWLEQALAGWRALKNRYGEASSLSNRGILLKEIGEFDEARQNYDQARRLFRSLHETRGEALATNNIALAYEALGQSADAIRMLAEAVRLFRLVPDRRAEGRALLLTARIELGRGRRTRALSVLRQGLPLVRAAGDRLAEADGLHTLARAEDAAGDHARAQTDFSRAVSLHRELGSRRGEADDLHALGVSLLAQGHCGEAADQLRAALSIRRDTGLRRPEADSLFWLARADRACGDLDSAQAGLDSAIALTEALRGGLAGYESRTAYLTSNLAYYSSYVDLLAERHRNSPDEGFDERAFTIVEQARAREAVERLRESWLSASAVGDRRLLARERELRGELNYWSWQLFQQADRRGTSADVSPLAERVQQLLVQHANAEADLRRSDRRFEALAVPDAVDATIVQHQLLDDKTVLLEFMLGDERSYAWVLTDGAVRLSELPARGVIERRARRLQQFLSSSRTVAPTATAQKQADEDRRVLGRVLLGPIASQRGRRQVIVVPDGALHYLPFAVLADPADRSGRPYGATHDITVGASAGLLLQLKARAPATDVRPGTVAVLADAVFDATDARVRATGSRTGVANSPIRRLSRLPFSRQEAHAILGMLPEKDRLAALDFDANRSAATSHALAQFQAIHFATHAVADDSNPTLSRVVLSLVDSAGRSQDGFLRLADLYGLRIASDLVVLSACETGLGTQTGQEGVASLARGFLFAGARRVVSSLWTVDDEATAQLMEHFYRAWLGRARFNAAAALRIAQSAIRAQKRWEDPYYWAGFTVEGLP